eukprot:TRINITY_DN833_c0_g1_i12.p1 TRINITY_DN833_c0_g1~~TRINITY_DN833_c0_g1_i12.p1  ORF type:complete len:587 (+),score=167.17 TRINITY_DN833_c0_g1_i12:343-2103(+)
MIYRTMLFVAWVVVWVTTALCLFYGFTSGQLLDSHAHAPSQGRARGGVPIVPDGASARETQTQVQAQQRPASSSMTQPSGTPVVAGLPDTLTEGNRKPLPVAPVGPPTPSECGVHRERFLGDYAAALGAVNWGSPPKFGLPGRFADGDAFCGRFLLYNRTSEMWHAVGAGLAAASTLSPTTVSLYNCAEGAAQCADLHITARLMGPTIVSAEVTRREGECAYDVTYVAYEPGEYTLHIKVVHLNASSFNPKAPLSLGLDRSRVRQDGRKLFARHNTCASQRHIHGSPFRVAVTGPPAHPTTERATPLCTRGDYMRGRWVPFPNADFCKTPQPYCAGNPWWLSDAYGYNTEWLWAPVGCHYHVYSPPVGPDKPCFDRKGTVGIVGDSIAREFVQNCRLFKGLPDKAGFHCEHWHMIVNGEYFSESYARDVAGVVGRKVESDNPVAIIVNLGMMHMIGMCNDTQWDYFIRAFAQELQKHPPKHPVRKIWLGAPQVHYATRGMTVFRARRWDDIALRHLRPLGFELFDSAAVTHPKEEGSWDGLHNAAEKGHKQSKVRNKRVPEFKWNGGVSHMLFNNLVNMLCNKAGS